jgi:hypothetical protein
VVESKGARLNLFKMLKSTMVRSGWGDEVTVMVQVEGLRVKALVDFGVSGSERVSTMFTWNRGMILVDNRRAMVLNNPIKTCLSNRHLPVVQPELQHLADYLPQAFSF